MTGKDSNTRKTRRLKLWHDQLMGYAVNILESKGKGPVTRKRISDLTYEDFTKIGVELSRVDLGNLKQRLTARLEKGTLNVKVLREGPFKLVAPLPSRYKAGEVIIPTIKILQAKGPITEESIRRLSWVDFKKHGMVVAPWRLSTLKAVLRKRLKEGTLDLQKIKARFTPSPKTGCGELIQAAVSILQESGPITERKIKDLSMVDFKIRGIKPSRTVPALRQRLLRLHKKGLLK